MVTCTSLRWRCNCWRNCGLCTERSWRCTSLRRRGVGGATLVELMVVLALWSTIMTAVLGFYIYGTEVSRRYDALSAQLREVQKLYDLIVGRITQAEVLAIQEGSLPAIHYVRTRLDSPLRSDGLPNWRPQDEILAIVPDSERCLAQGVPTLTKGLCFFNHLVVQENGQEVSTLWQLPDGMAVRFQPQGGLIYMEVRVPIRTSRQPKIDLRTYDLADSYQDKYWRKVTRVFIVNGWPGAN